MVKMNDTYIYICPKCFNRIETNPSIWQTMGVNNKYESCPHCHEMIFLRIHDEENRLMEAVPWSVHLEQIRDEEVDRINSLL